MVTARSRALLVLPALAGALLLSGCGDPTTEPGSGGGEPTTVDPTRAPAPPSSAIPLPPAPTDLPTASGRPVSIDGVIEDGVEPGCKVLTAGGSSYLLLGGGADVPTGVPVRVQGVLTPGVLTTCQQGTPLRVTNVQRR
jgi:hypothetical protein